MGLLDLLFRKQRRIEAMVHAYLDEWEACIDHYKRGFDAYLETGFDETFFDFVEKTHQSESRADDIRRSIEYEMYEKALIPESRGDVLGLLENLDRIPNRAETVLFLLASERVALPKDLAPGLSRLVILTDEAIRMLLGMARGVFERNPDLATMVREVDRKESACDRIKRELIRTVATLERGSFEKVTLRDLVLAVSELSDLAENIADRIMILSLKRKV